MTDPLVFKLLSVLSSYPEDGAFLEVAGQLASLPEGPKSLSGWSGSVSDLRSDYIDLFDRGRAANPIYETEYGRDRTMVKGHDLADIAGFYKAYGLGWEEGEMVDHVAVELEFYSWLCLKQQYLEEEDDTQGREVVLDGRRKFLDDHLGRFVAAIAERPAIQVHSFYGPLFTFCAERVAAECRELGVEPKLLSYLSLQAESETMSCGAVCNPK